MYCQEDLYQKCQATLVVWLTECFAFMRFHTN